MNNNIVGITQCAVSPYDSFQYNFTVNEAPGTYWYHTHSGHLGIEGYNAIKGPLIVHEKRPLHLNETGFFKGFDAKASDTSLLSYNNERILFFSDGFLLSALHVLVVSRRPVAGLGGAIPGLEYVR